MKTNPTNPLDSTEEQIDKIIYRCFEQGLYWGTASGIDDDEENKLNPDYLPDEPIDRTEAVKAIMDLIKQRDIRLQNEARQTVLKELVEDSYEIELTDIEYYEYHNKRKSLEVVNLKQITDRITTPTTHKDGE